MRRDFVSFCQFGCASLLAWILSLQPCQGQIRFAISDESLAPAVTSSSEGEPDAVDFGTDIESLLELQATDETRGESDIRLTQLQLPPPPASGAQPSAVASTAPTFGLGLTTSTFGTSVGLGGITSQRTSGRQAKVLAATDAGSLAAKSAALNVAAENRTPIVTDTRVRGSGVGQLTASGSYWFPARQDLDTMLSKIDSRIVDSMTVIKGPYSARYGPGFDFINFELLPAERFPGGPESHGSSSIEYKSNGEQWYGRQTAWAGSDYWGVRIGYGHRTGSDYETGAGFELPSSYNSRSPDVAIGLDLTDNARIDFHYLRLDQTDVEFPGQFYDINYLGTDAYELELVWENQCLFDQLTVEGWYNRTRFHGDTLRPGKRRQIEFIRENSIDSRTRASASSAGYSLAVMWGELDSTHLTFGSDLRFLKQRLTEITHFGAPIPANRRDDTLIPPAESSNPGLFLESALQLTDLMLRTGGRVDWMEMNADRFVDRDGNGSKTDDLQEDFFLGETLNREYDFGSMFISAEHTLNPQWTAIVGVGHAIRSPTMTELYSVDPFIAVFPQIVATSVRGNPTLLLPRITQADLGLSTESDRFRGGVSAFYAWVENYITFDRISDVVYRYINTELATLSGGEVFGEYELNSGVTVLGTLSYVEGRDQTLNMRRAAIANEEPLPVISPLQSRIGVRVHDPGENRRWAVELIAIVVDNQDRIAMSLGEQITPGFTAYDMRAYWQASDDLLITAGVENLTDKFYRSHFDTVIGGRVFQPGANFYFGTEVNY